LQTLPVTCCWHSKRAAGMMPNSQETLPKAVPTNSKQTHSMVMQLPWPAPVSNLAAMQMLQTLKEGYRMTTQYPWLYHLTLTSVQLTCAYCSEARTNSCTTSLLSLISCCCLPGWLC